MSEEGTLEAHVQALAACQRCSKMHRPAITTGPVRSKVVLVGQAPGPREPELGRPFAWTAGKTLFRWLYEATTLDEEAIRRSVYIASVCRCFPGKTVTGGDRVPDKAEMANCRPWLQAEMQILQPDLVIPIGKLAISQFLKVGKLVDVIGRVYPSVVWSGHAFDLLPLPHPSGASTWHRMEPGKALTQRALDLIQEHAAIRRLIRGEDRAAGSRT